MFAEMNWQDIAVGLGLSVTVALVVAQLGSRIVRLGFLAVSAETEGAGFRDAITRRPIRITRTLLFVSVLALITRPIFEMLGVELGYGLSLERTSTWLVGEGLRILLIAALAYFATRVASLGIDHFEAVVADRGSDNRDTLDFANRLHTIGGLVKNAVNVLVIGAATLMILEEFGVNITPLLTAAGIGGLAVGFGAQNLVRDVISGFFLILEDQIHVGDVVKIDDTSGLVESVKLRTVVLRDLSGTVHIIPNGSITTLSNMSKEFSYSVMDVGVAYKEDTDTVVDVLRDVGADIQSDKDFGQHILDELEVLGVDDFADSAVTIKIRIKTRPLKQWMVGRELRRRIKKAFDTAGIEIPFPHISLYMGEVSNPFLTRPMTASEEVDLAEKRAQQATVKQTSTRRRTSSARDASDTEGLGDVG